MVKVWLCMVRYSERRSNLRLMQELGLVGRLLHVLNDPSISVPTLRAVSALLSILLSPPVHAPSLIRWGVFSLSLWYFHSELSPYSIMSTFHYINVSCRGLPCVLSVTADKKWGKYEEDSTFTIFFKFAICQSPFVVLCHAHSETPLKQHRLVCPGLVTGFVQIILTCHNGFIPRNLSTTSQFYGSCLTLTWHVPNFFCPCMLCYVLPWYAAILP